MHIFIIKKSIMILLIIFPLILLMSGCGKHIFKLYSLDEVRMLPLSEGQEKIVNTNLQNVIQASQDTAEEFDLMVQDVYQHNDSTWILLAEREYDFYKGSGELLRLVFIKQNNDNTKIKFISKRAMNSVIKPLFTTTYDDFYNKFDEKLSPVIAAQNNIKPLSKFEQFLQKNGKSKLNIAVFPIEPFGFSSVEAYALTNRLISELFRTGYFNILELEKMEKILEEQGFQQTGCTSTECLVQAGKILQVEQIIGCKILKVEDYFAIEIRLYEVETSEINALTEYDIKGSIDNVLVVGIKNSVAQLVE